MTTIHLLLDEARQQLADKPYDAAHDLGHHLEVMARALDLAHKLEPEVVDLDALRIAVMWHHLPLNEQGQKTSKATIEALRQKMDSESFRPEFIEKVIEAVGAYALDQSPKTIEGKILFDADKLELLSPQRWLRYNTAIERGDISAEKAKKDFSWLSETLKSVRDKLYFQQSKQLFDKLAPKLRENSSVRAAFARYNVTI